MHSIRFYFKVLYCFFKCIRQNFKICCLRNQLRIIQLTVRHFLQTDVYELCCNTLSELGRPIQKLTSFFRLRCRYRHFSCHSREYTHFSTHASKFLTTSRISLKEIRCVLSVMQLDLKNFLCPPSYVLLLLLFTKWKGKYFYSALETACGLMILHLLDWENWRGPLQRDASSLTLFAFSIIAVVKIPISKIFHFLNLN